MKGELKKVIFSSAEEITTTFFRLIKFFHTRLKITFDFTIDFLDN